MLSDRAGANKTQIKSSVVKGSRRGDGRTDGRGGGTPSRASASAISTSCTASRNSNRPSCPRLNGVFPLPLVCTWRQWRNCRAQEQGERAAALQVGMLAGWQHVHLPQTTAAPHPALTPHKAPAVTEPSVQHAELMPDCAATGLSASRHRWSNSVAMAHGRIVWMQTVAHRSRRCRPGCPLAKALQRHDCSRQEL